MTVGYGQPREEKESKIRGKNPNLSRSHSPKSHTNTKLKIITYMQRTWYRLVFRPHAFCFCLYEVKWHLLRCLEDLVFMGFSDSHSLFASSSTVSMSSKERDLVETFHVLLCVPRIPSVARGNFFDDGWIRHQFMNIAGYHKGFVLSLPL